MNTPTVHLPEKIHEVAGDVILLGVEVSEKTSRLTRPLQTSTGTMRQRHLLRVILHAEIAGHRRTGWGEAAPLEWWGSEKLDHVRYELRRLSEAVGGGAELTGATATEMMRLPTARFAVESAVLDAAAQAKGVPIRRLFARRPPNEVRLNATIGLVDAKRASEKATEAVAAGFETLKIKVGGAIEDDLARVDAVRRAASGARLRLDANGAWDESEALERVNDLAGDDVEYIEQPVEADRIDVLERIANAAGVPIAADESCLPLSRARTLIDGRAVSALVLKPSLLGAWSDVMETVAHADKLGVHVVFTSAIDSAISRAVVAQFASLRPPDTAHGLAPGGWLEEEDRREEFVRDGRLYLGSGNGIGFRPKPAGETS